MEGDRSSRGAVSYTITSSTSSPGARRPSDKVSRDLSPLNTKYPQSCDAVTEVEVEAVWGSRRGRREIADFAVIVFRLPGLHPSFSPAASNTSKVRVPTVYNGTSAHDVPEVDPG